MAPALAGISISPNPFRELAVISYQLQQKGIIELKIYNLKGQLLRHLYSGMQEKGEQVLAWEACDDKGRQLPSGVYLLRINIDAKAHRTLKMLKL